MSSRTGVNKCKRILVMKCRGSLRDPLDKYGKYAYWCSHARDGWSSIQCEHKLGTQADGAIVRRPYTFASHDTDMTLVDAIKFEIRRTCGGFNQSPLSDETMDKFIANLFELKAIDYRVNVRILIAEITSFDAAIYEMIVCAIMKATDGDFHYKRP